MLDEDLCRGMEIVERPTLAITALVRVCALQNLNFRPKPVQYSGENRVWLTYSTLVTRGCLDIRARSLSGCQILWQAGATVNA